MELLDFKAFIYHTLGSKLPMTQEVGLEENRGAWLHVDQFVVNYPVVPAIVY